MSDNGRFLQTCKARVFKRLLSPAGFEKGNRMYVRQSQGQIHAVQFQTATWGGRYFVNVGFHFDFLPGMMAMTQQRNIGYTQFDLLDLLMYNRLEALMPRPYPRDWQYGREIADTEANLELNARNAIGAIDGFGQRWRDPADFMRAFPPEILERDHAEAIRRIDIHGAELAKLPELPVDAILGQPGWYLERDNLAYCLTVIAIRLKHRGFAEAYLALARSEYRAPVLAPLEEQLRALA